MNPTTIHTPKPAMLSISSDEYNRLQRESQHLRDQNNQLCKEKCLHEIDLKRIKALCQPILAFLARVESQARRSRIAPGHEPFPDCLPVTCNHAAKAGEGLTLGDLRKLAEVVR